MAGKCFEQLRAGRQQDQKAVPNIRPTRPLEHALNHHPQCHVDAACGFFASSFLTSALGAGISVAATTVDGMVWSAASTFGFLASACLAASVLGAAISAGAAEAGFLAATAFETAISVAAIGAGAPDWSAVSADIAPVAETRIAAISSCALTSSMFIALRILPTSIIKLKTSLAKQTGVPFRHLNFRDGRSRPSSACAAHFCLCSPNPSLSRLISVSGPSSQSGGLAKLNQR
jgi:hypothetical protein